MLTCKAILKKGNRRCSRTPGDDGFCYQHRKVPLPIAPIVPKGDPIALPLITTTCSICLEDPTPAEDADLSCRHALHLTCAEKLHDSHCPTCREEISSANSKLKEKQIEAIKARCLQDRDERAEESFQAFMEEEEDNREEDREEANGFGDIVAMFQGVVANQNNLFLRALIEQGVQGMGQAAAPVGGDQNGPVRLVVAAPFNADFDGDVDPVDLIGMVRQGANPPRVFHDPAADSAEEMAILSWILDRKVEGMVVTHEGLHLRYPNYSCQFLTLAENKADIFLVE